MPEVLQTAKEMLVEILDTAEVQFDDAALAEPLDRLREVYDITKQVEKEANQLSLNGLAQMFGFKGGQHNPTRDKYQKLGHDYVELLSKFFTMLESEFQSPDKAREWNDSWQGFSSELALRW